MYKGTVRTRRLKPNHPVVLALLKDGVAPHVAEEELRTLYIVEIRRFVSNQVNEDVVFLSRFCRRRYDVSQEDASIVLV